MHITLFPVLNLLFFYISTFRSTCAVTNTAVFCSSLISCFPGMLLRYCLNYFEMVPVAHIITGITSVFAFHMCCMVITRSLYFIIFSASFCITFLSPEMATYTRWFKYDRDYLCVNKSQFVPVIFEPPCISIHVPFSLPRIIMSGLLLGMVLSVCTCWFHNMVNQPSWLVSTHFGTCSHHWSLVLPVSLHMLKCSWTHYHVSCIVLFPVPGMLI